MAKKQKTKKDLTKKQVEVLKSLSRLKNGVTRVKLADRVKIDHTMVGQIVGYQNPEINQREVHQYNLVNRGLVSIVKEDVNGRDVVFYKITAKGRKALKK